VGARSRNNVTTGGGLEGQCSILFLETMLLDVEGLAMLHKVLTHCTRQFLFIKQQ
jgi:hypothetical protein